MAAKDRPSAFRRRGCPSSDCRDIRSRSDPPSQILISKQQDVDCSALYRPVQVTLRLD
jgi:hypothetical protein